MEIGKLFFSAIGAKLPDGFSWDREISGIYTDSRKVTEGSIFVCHKGLHYDGHQYIGEALAHGALAVITEAGSLYPDIDESMLCGKVIAQVKSTREATAYLFNEWYGRPSDKLKFIGVTGTNGKTSVTYMLKAIYEAAMFKCGLIGTIKAYSCGKELNPGNSGTANFTTPDPENLYRLLAEMANDGAEYVIMEVTSHSLQLGKIAPLKFDVGIFTNLTPEHLDFHGTMEKYLAAKQRLFAECRLAIINGESPYADSIAESAGGKCVLCGISRTGCDLYAYDIKDKGAFGTEYTLVSDKAIIKIKTPIPGSFTVMNTMEAAACALYGGISLSVIKTALASIYGVLGRMEKVKLENSDMSVFIDYAHTPDALENLLESVIGFRKNGQRIITVFGCGGDRDRSKRSVMGEIAGRLSDYVIVTSDNSRSEDPSSIIDEIVSGIGSYAKYEIIEDRRAAIERAVCQAENGDIILLAGKGHELYEIDKNGKHPFDEREIVREAIKNSTDRR